MEFSSFVVYFILSSVLTCVQGARLTAHFDENNIRGLVNFYSPANNASNVTIEVQLTQKSSDKLSLQILTYPVKYLSFSDSNPNPVLHDLNSTHGHLNLNKNYSDSNIKLVGKQSILGRGIVLRYNDSSVAAASVILPVINSHYAKAVISNSQIAGSFEFISSADSGLMIYGEVSHSDGTTTDSTGHEWFIYSPTTPGVSCENFNAIYNPETQNGNCTNAQEASCKLGDLASKFGSLTIGNGGSSRFFGNDVKLRLGGAHSIVNQALVIRNKAKNETLGCGMIKMAGPLAGESTFSAAMHQGVAGKFSFTQNSPYQPTKLQVQLNGLNQAGGYHVHLFPISDPSNPCSPASVSGHLNPYNVDVNTSPPANQGSVDLYETGDLSGKFGSLVNQTTFNLMKMDLNLPLYGSNTVFGRSVVIHKNDASASRWVCADIVAPAAKASLSSVVNFTAMSHYATHSQLSGSVLMKQYIQSNDIMSPTVFVVDLNYKNDSNKQTSNHNFHVHISPIGNESATCVSALGHYNPANVNAIGAVYTSQCNAMHPYRCEIGDTSSKVGTYNIGAGKAFYADFSTPLFGQHTSLGRSLVFHAENKGAPRISCSDTVPNQHQGEAVKLGLDIMDKSLMNDLSRLTKSIGDALQITASKQWKINSLKTSDSSIKTNCFHVTFYVLDKRQDYYRNLLKSVTDNWKVKHFKKCEKDDSSSTKLGSNAIYPVILLLTVTLRFLF